MSTNTEWSIGEVLKTANEKQVGFKMTYVIAFAIYAAISIAIALVQEATVGTAGDVGDSLVEILVTLLLFPLGVGFGLLGIRRAVGKETPVSTLWEPYSHAIPLIVMFVMMAVLIIAGFFLLVLPGIYLSIAYSFAPYLIVEKNMGAWEALETSRKAITQYWWRYFGLMLVALLLIIIGSIPLLIGLVWVFPIVAIATGEVFAKTFGDPKVDALDSDIE
ncbi:MAG: hypothetical protein GWP37_07275 [Gammaproteobacteria bacterium]|nr:hypothetical protein [Gammaproteobacteria bacterium]